MVACHYVICVKISTGAALSVVVRDVGGRLGPDFAKRRSTSHPRPGDRGSIPAIGLAHGPVLLMRNTPEFSAGQLDLAMAASRWPDDRASALLLFDFLTEPQVIHRPTVVSGNIRFDIQLRGQGYWLGKAWTDVFVPHLGEAAAAVLAIVDRHLRRAHLYCSRPQGRPSQDGIPLSFDRSAVDTASAGTEHTPAIRCPHDAARDCIETLLDHEGEAGAAYLRMWADTDVPLLRRLAVHGWTCAGDLRRLGQAGVAPRSRLAVRPTAEA